MNDVQKLLKWQIFADFDRSLTDTRLCLRRGLLQLFQGETDGIATRLAIGNHLLLADLAGTRPGIS